LAIYQLLIGTEHIYSARRASVRAAAAGLGLALPLPLPTGFKSAGEEEEGRKAVTLVRTFRRPATEWL